MTGKSIARRGAGSRVLVYSKSTAVGALPVKPGKTYPLSVLDHAMAKHVLRLVFYYPRASGVTPLAMDRERLKESLSDVLTQYPAVTGRLVRGEADGNWAVKCNDAGVRVVDAKVGVSMEEWFRTAADEEEMDLAYWEEMGEEPYIWSPFYIQITEFEDGGVAIGLSCPHMYADPTCATLLVKAWSDAHRRACIDHPPFFHPPGLRGRQNPNTSTPSAALLASKSTASSPSPPPHMSTATFRFNDQSLRAALDEIRPSSPNASPFDALAALFWCRISRSNNLNQSPQLTLCIDFRKRMYAPLPHGFFGNALHYSAVDQPSSGLTWGAAAEAVRAHLAGLEEEEYWSAVDWAEGRRRENGGYGPAFQMYGPGLTCVMLDHVFAYGAVFDGEAGGKGPAHVTYRVEGSVEGEGLVLVLPHPEEEGGRTVTVTLPEDRMDEICRDEVIVGRLGATMVFGGGK